MAGIHAVVLAGGYGTRLAPLTARRPKHLLPVAGKPLVVHQLEWLRDAGIADVTLATSYRAAQFDPVVGDGSRWGLRLHQSREPQPLGTAGAVAHATAPLGLEDDDVVVVVNGDQLTGHDVRRQISAFRTARQQDGATLSIHARTVDDARAFGVLDVDEHDRIRRFHEKPAHQGTGLVNAGTYVMSPSAIAAICHDAATSLEHDVFPSLLSRGERLVAHRDEAYGIDVGTPASLVRASQDAVRRDYGEALVRHDTTVHPRADVVAGSFVDSGATVARDASIAGTIVMRGAHVGAGAALLDSVIGPGVVVGADVTVQSAAIGDEAVLEDHVVLGPGSTVGVAQRAAR